MELMSCSTKKVSREMKGIDEIKASGRLVINRLGLDGGNGWLYHPLFKKPMVVVFSWGGGWDHVSVSFRNKTPTWDEMCIVKDIFFHENECVIQYHPPKSEYVNNHPHTLHLWKPQNGTIPMPPKIFV